MQHHQPKPSFSSNSSSSSSIIIVIISIIIIITIIILVDPGARTRGGLLEPAVGLLLANTCTQVIFQLHYKL